MFANKKKLTVDALKRKAAGLNLNPQALDARVSFQPREAVTKELDKGQGRPARHTNN